MSTVAGGQYDQMLEALRADDAAALRGLVGLPSDIRDSDVIDAVSSLVAGMDAFARGDGAAAARAFEEADPVIGRSTEDGVRTNFAVARELIRGRELAAGGRYWEAEQTFQALADEVGTLASRYDVAPGILRNLRAELAVARVNVAIAQGEGDEASRLAAEAGAALENRGEDQPDDVKARCEAEGLSFKVEVSSRLAEIAIHEFDFELARQRLAAGANDAQRLVDATETSPQVQVVLARREAVMSLLDLGQLLDQDAPPDAKTLKKRADTTAAKLDALAKFAYVDTDMDVAQEVRELGRAAQLIASSGRSGAQVAQSQLPFGIRGSALLVGGIGVVVLALGVFVAIKLGGWQGVVIGGIVCLLGIILAIVAGMGLQAQKSVPVVTAFAKLVDSGAKVADAAAKFKSGGGAGSGGAGSGGAGGSGQTGQTGQTGGPTPGQPSGQTPAQPGAPTRPTT